MAKQKITVNRALVLAKSYAAKGQVERAQRLYSMVLANSPQNKKAKKGLEALQNRAAQRTQPRLTQPVIDHLMALCSTGKLKIALGEAKRLSQVHPNVPMLHNVMATCYANLGQLNSAVKSYKRALEIKPDYAVAHKNLGSAFGELGQFEAAVSSFERALEIKPDYFEASCNLGKALDELGQEDAAAASYERALEIKPDNAELHRSLGTILKSLGQIDAAVAHLERALEIKPDDVFAHKSLSTLKTYKPGDIQIDIMDRLLSASKTNETNRMHLCFALARAYDDTGDYGKGFDSLEEANRLRKKTLNYNIDDSKRFFSNIKEVFGTQSVSTNAVPSDKRSTIQSIFIVGMPRSGTSLVEQILASHTKVFGAGELTTIGRFLKPIVRKFSGRVDGQHNNQTDQHVDTLRCDYLEVLAALNVSEKVITDKMPLNFMWIGYILSAFPAAKIINLNRDPRATCWSLYKHNFTPDGNGYAYDMADLAQFYKLYFDLMSFWRKHFPHQIYDICYEDLTENQEEETRKLLEFCDLDWEEDCLNFHETERLVKTASAVQVRQKMYKGSSEAWKRYEVQLQPMIKSLASVLTDTPKETRAGTATS